MARTRSQPQGGLGPDDIIPPTSPASDSLWLAHLTVREAARLRGENAAALQKLVGVVNSLKNDLKTELTRLDGELKLQGKWVDGELKRQGEQLDGEFKLQGDRMNGELKLQGERLDRELKRQGERVTELSTTIKVAGGLVAGLLTCAGIAMKYFTWYVDADTRFCTCCSRACAKTGGWRCRPIERALPAAPDAAASPNPQTPWCPRPCGSALGARHLLV